MRFIDAENFKLTQKPEYCKHYTYYDLIEEGTIKVLNL